MAEEFVTVVMGSLRVLGVLLNPQREVDFGQIITIPPFLCGETNSVKREEWQHRKWGMRNAVNSETHVFVRAAMADQYVILRFRTDSPAFEILKELADIFYEDDFVAYSVYTGDKNAVWRRLFNRGMTQGRVRHDGELVQIILTAPLAELSDLKCGVL